jgi:hypothetical protein
MKKALSLLLIVVLLYQAGGFALKFIFDNDLSVSNLDNTETVIVKLPISLPYHTDWETPKEVKGELRNGDDFYQMKEQIMKNDTLYTTLVADRSARENFFDLANQVNEHLSDQPDKSPSKSKLINTLIKEYCSNTSSWVFYIIEWPSETIKSNHPIQSTTEFSSDSFYPPQHA